MEEVLSDTVHSKLREYCSLLTANCNLYVDSQKCNTHTNLSKQCNHVILKWLILLPGLSENTTINYNTKLHYLTVQYIFCDHPLTVGRRPSDVVRRVSTFYLNDISSLTTVLIFTKLHRNVPVIVLYENYF